MAAEFTLTPPSPPPKYSRILFSAKSPHFATPKELYAELHREFGFTFDPCPFQSTAHDGLVRSWAGQRVYCNPPYGRGIGKWLAKSREAELSVYLLPARTDTAWFHAWAPSAAEVRFLRGRLHFNDAANPAVFPSLLLIFQ